MSDLKSKTEALRKSKEEEFATACPSRVIEMALEDLEVIEGNERYLVNMGFWHEPAGGHTYWRDLSLGNKCFVCLAGSVMASRLGADPEMDLTPSKIAMDRPGVWNRLRAVDLFRRGVASFGCDLVAGTGVMVPNDSDFKPDFPITDYDADPTAFKSDMRAMAEMLKAKGL